MEAVYYYINSKRCINYTREMSFTEHESRAYDMIYETFMRLSVIINLTTHSFLLVT